MATKEYIATKDVFAGGVLYKKGETVLIDKDALEKASEEAREKENEGHGDGLVSLKEYVKIEGEAPIKAPRTNKNPTTPVVKPEPVAQKTESGTVVEEPTPRSARKNDALS